MTENLKREIKETHREGSAYEWKSETVIQRPSRAVRWLGPLWHGCERADWSAGSECHHVAFGLEFVCVCVRWGNSFPLWKIVLCLAHWLSLSPHSVHTHIHTLKNQRQTFLCCQYICQEKKREQMSEIKRKMLTNCGISHGTEAPLPWVRSRKGWKSFYCCFLLLFQHFALSVVVSRIGSRWRLACIKLCLMARLSLQTHASVANPEGVNMCKQTM